MYQKLLLFILLIAELTKITFCWLKFLLFLSWYGAKLFKTLQTVCLCFKLGSLYFIKTSISFSLLKKVEKSIHKSSHFLVENIKTTAILLNFLISSKAVENSPQFSSIFILKQEWQSCYSQCFTIWKGFFNNFHKGQLHCTQYYFFKYCSFKFETVSSRLLPLDICSTQKYVFSNISREFAKFVPTFLRALHAYAPYLPMWLRALNYYVPTCL